jgi:hypothetical protein
MYSLFIPVLELWIAAASEGIGVNVLWRKGPIVALKTTLKFEYECIVVSVLTGINIPSCRIGSSS